MSPEQHELYEQDTGAYVLGALEEAEVTRFTAHLRTCHVCRDEVDRLTAAVNALPRSVPPFAAPAGLKASVMAAIDAEVRENAPPSEATAGQRLRARIGTIGAAFGGIRPRVASLSVMAVLAVGLAAGFGVAELTSGGSDTRTVAARFDTSKVANGSGNLVISDNADSGATLHVHGMPALPSNEIYQVWVKRQGEVIPKALFSVGDNGDGITAIDGDLKDADSVMVTREPAGGARSPSGRPVLRVRL